MKSVSREPNEIISMMLSHNEDHLAVISGKNLIMTETYPNQLFIFKRMRVEDVDKFELFKRIVIRDKPEYSKISMQFCFKLTKPGMEPTHIIFAK